MFFCFQFRNPQKKRHRKSVCVFEKKFSENCEKKRFLKLFFGLNVGGAKKSGCIIIIIIEWVCLLVCMGVFCLRVENQFKILSSVFFAGFFKFKFKCLFSEMLLLLFSQQNEENCWRVYSCVCVCFKQQKFKFFPLSLSPQRQFDNEMNELRWWWSSSSSDIGE